MVVNLSFWRMMKLALLANYLLFNFHSSSIHF